MERIKLALSSDVVEGEPLAIMLDGFPQLAVYRVNDHFFVTDNLCTHGNAMLTEGFQDGTSIECPFHGGRFNIETGKATLYPCQIALKTYEAIVENGFIYITRLP
jgi:ethylbenzene dioxygenase ferredoxin component